MATRQTTAVDRVTLADRDADPPRVRTFASGIAVEIEGFHWTAWVRGVRPRVHGWQARAVAGSREIARGTVVDVGATGDARLRLDVAPPEQYARR